MTTNFVAQVVLEKSSKCQCPFEQSLQRNRKKQKLGDFKFADKTGKSSRAANASGLVHRLAHRRNSPTQFVAIASAVQKIVGGHFLQLIISFILYFCHFSAQSNFYVQSNCLLSCQIVLGFFVSCACFLYLLLILNRVSLNSGLVLLIFCHTSKTPNCRDLNNPF